MHDAYATLLVPPESILRLSVQNPNSDTGVAHSVGSRDIVAYHRPFRFQLNPSLTDIRSMRSSLSSNNLSTASSGIPGPGYILGKFIKLTGEKMLDTVTAVEILRRVWLDKRMVKQMEKRSAEDIERTFKKRGKAVLQLVDDLLELSSNDYKAKHRTISLKYGQRFNDILWHLLTVELGPWYWVLVCRIAPLTFLREDGEHAVPLSWCNALVTR